MIFVPQRYEGHGSAMAQIEDVNVKEALALLDQGALLLDVREDDEWDLGHAPQATHVALSEVPDHLDDFDKSRRIVCVCRSGGRSKRAGQFLAEQGFSVVNLAGGMTAWAAEEAPLESDEGTPTIG
jgi:rhodanese-related sulfurtransferase